MTKKIISYMLAVIFVISTIQVNVHAEDNNFRVVAESDTLILYYSDKKQNIKVKDKRNGYIWSGILEEQFVKQADMTDYFVMMANSFFNIEYTNLNENTNNAKKSASNELKREVTTEKMQDGIRLIYFLNDLKMKITFEITIEDETLSIKVPASGIEEKIGMDEYINEKLAQANEHYTELRALIDEASELTIKDKELKSQIKKFNDYIKSYEKDINNINVIEGLTDIAFNTRSTIVEANKLIVGSEGISGIKYFLKHMGNEEGQKGVEIYTLISKKCLKLMSVLQSLSSLKASGIVRLDIIPFFGAANDYDDGYMFYPDGSGAITYFKEVHQERREFFKKDVFSDIVIDLDKSGNLQDNGYENSILPVYGININGHGLVATMHLGSSYSDVNFYPSGYNMNVNRVNFGSVYRNTFNYAMENVKDSGSKNQHAGTGAKYGKKQIYSKDAILLDHEIKYMFLEDNQSDYSGMANRYRKYLVEENKLVKSSEMDKETVPLGLDLFMGIIEERILLNKFIKMTTYEQAKFIVEDLYNNDVANIQTNLIGWMNGGYGDSLDSYKLENRLGSKSKFNSMITFIKDLDMSVFLVSNPIDTVKQGLGGVNTSKDVARIQSGMQLTDRLINRFIVSTNKILDRYIKGFVELLRDSNISGSAFERLGSFVYDDYNAYHGIKNREETIMDYQKLMSMSKENFGMVAAYGGNLYTLQDADRLLEIPQKSTGYFFTDESIPFYQLVVHGYIPYSSKPFNLFYDWDAEKLRAIEYGNIPYFKLTYASADEMIYTDYTSLFSSEYSIWKEKVISIYSEFNDKLGDLWKQEIIKHEIIDDNLRCVSYKDSTQVYLNYSDKVINYKGYNISPKDYIVVAGGEIK